MPKIADGPSTKLFSPVSFEGNVVLTSLKEPRVSKSMADTVAQAASGECVAWGIPFEVGRKVVLIKEKTVAVKVKPFKAGWLVFMHAADVQGPDQDKRGRLTGSWTGFGRLKEHLADYVVVYADGTEERTAIRRRHQLGMIQRGWGENCFEAVWQHKPKPVLPHHEQEAPSHAWGSSQTRAVAADWAGWMNWLWAWENPHPGKRIVALRFEPVAGAVVLSAISAGTVEGNPLRWETRKKAVLSLAKGAASDPRLDADGLLKAIRLDLGQVISAVYKPDYPNDRWAKTPNNKLAEYTHRDFIVEYTAHPAARFHLEGGKTVAAAALEGKGGRAPLTPIAPATQRITFRALEAGTGKPVAVKLHVHGQAGEYLPPVDRHRIPNCAWFEDYSVDFTHCAQHHCTYIDGTTRLDVPLGKVYVEVSKGFEIQPIRKVFSITPATREIVVRLKKVLPWREAGWVTADTHVHFLSPTSAGLEGAGEGVNVVNLLASQWGELMTNVGDFDGKTTFGSKEAGGSGEYLVRVGTENRQHILGHISLLGYNGPIIAPMTTGGPDESALGDPVEILMTEWARQCTAAGGVVVIPHFPNPRAEHAAAIVDGHVSGIEVTSWGNLYYGVDPYSLADWYRYLNCGYFVAAVGGTDKMGANTAVGTVRTYARIPRSTPFTYDAWKDAVRAGRTFVTYGPLMEFAVEGREPGARLTMPASGGTVDVAWKVASVTVPMTKVELIVNGVVRQSQAVRPGADSGHWSVKVDKSSWLALLVRGQYKGMPPMIAAHSSPVMAQVKGSPFMAAADAMTILDQIEASIAYLDTVGTKAQAKVYKRMRLVLTGVHRQLHNRMHQAGCFHQHGPTTDHKEHH